MTRLLVRSTGGMLTAIVAGKQDIA